MYAVVGFAPVSDKTTVQHPDEWLSHMRRGDWESAWRISDRICCARLGRQPRDTTGRWLPRHLQWVWDGRPLAGERILIRCHHGLGDTVQFIRFAPLVKRSVRHVTVLAQAQLLPLLETVPGIDALLRLDDGPQDGRYEVAIEVMELAHALRVTPAMLPATIPYIHVNDKTCGPVYRTQPHVGLVWQSGSWDSRRSIPVQLMQELTQLDDIRFQILQRGPALASWSGSGAEVPPIANILEEAATLRSLDLLICVDTLSAHLAGALGVRTWTLLPAQADWRWMEGREDTPWYPTMRLFRQTRADDWESVMERVTTELASHVAVGSFARNS